MITHENSNANLANLPDRKSMYAFEKEMFFDEKALGNKKTRDKSLIRLLNSPTILASVIFQQNFYQKILMSSVMD